MIPFNIVSVALAVLTVMLWILWSDSVRPRSGGKVLYGVRVFIFLAVAAILVQRAVTSRPPLSGGAIALVAVTALVAVGGAVYFFRKAAARR
ncbi:MAG: hypothetical protein ACYC7A_06630 [Thermoanaerobaculia bacterium]